MIGDFNLPCNNPQETKDKQFMNNLDSFSLQQHILETIHVKDHIWTIPLINAKLAHCFLSIILSITNEAI